MYLRRIGGQEYSNGFSEEIVLEASDGVARLIRRHKAIGQGRVDAVDVTAIVLDEQSRTELIAALGGANEYLRGET